MTSMEQVGIWYYTVVMLFLLLPILSAGLIAAGALIEMKLWQRRQLAWLKEREKK